MSVFNFIHQFNNEYKSKYKTFVTGDSSAYLHILQNHNHEIKLKNIDLQIISEKEDDNLIIYSDLKDCLIVFCEENKLTFEFIDDNFSNLDEIKKIKILKNDNLIITLNYFINQIGMEEVPEISTIYNVPVLNYSDMYNKELEEYNLLKEYIKNYEADDFDKLQSPQYHEISNRIKIYESGDETEFPNKSAYEYEKRILPIFELDKEKIKEYYILCRENLPLKKEIYDYLIK
jgi:hypothetical protein